MKLVILALHADSAKRIFIVHVGKRFTSAWEASYFTGNTGLHKVAGYFPPENIVTALKMLQLHEFLGALPSGASLGPLPPTSFAAWVASKSPL